MRAIDKLFLLFYLMKLSQLHGLRRGIIGSYEVGRLWDENGSFTSKLLYWILPIV
jgi:hypothetical protein